MRLHPICIVLAGATLLTGPASAADIPDYPVIEIPEVDYGLEGSFYLRGSAAANMWWAKGAYNALGREIAIEEAGYGYSIGAGFGYETGFGLRFDATLDYLSMGGLKGDIYSIDLRSTIALANIYYDFSFDGFGAASGGWGGYIGAGLGGGYMQPVHHSEDPDEEPVPDGANFGAVGAVMAGVSYDAGTWVADLGYRGLYIPQITNGSASATPYYVDNNFVSEVRGTLRYRF